MTLPTNVHWCSVYMELQICERDVDIKDCLLVVLDQKPLGILFNLFKTQYTFEKGHWLTNRLERINIYETFVCARTRVRTEKIIYLHNLHKLLWRHITRFVPALRGRSLPPVFPRGVGTATRRLPFSLFIHHFSTNDVTFFMHDANRWSRVTWTLAPDISGQVCVS